ncbi:MAG TPA: hypothetical protein VM889_12385 [Candidatus Thermoplasmatota archaeon]|nr:hypothetical protein [Candidatus Thermoplasmatota archaeon]
MAASGVVQFRAPADVLAHLAAAGLNPNEVGRQAFEKEARRLLADAKRRKLAALAVRLPRRAADLVRDERESH